MNKFRGREIRIDAHSPAMQTGGMNTNEKTISELLAKALEITKATLGAAPDAIVAEVFRQLCLEREYDLLEEGDGDTDGDDDAPTALH